MVSFHYGIIRLFPTILRLHSFKFFKLQRSVYSFDHVLHALKKHHCSVGFKELSTIDFIDSLQKPRCVNRSSQTHVSQFANSLNSNTFGSKCSIQLQDINFLSWSQHIEDVILTSNVLFLL